MPWLTVRVSIGGEERSTTNYGYHYMIPMGVRYAAPTAILSVIGFVLSAYSFKATESVRKLNIIAGAMMVVGVMAAFIYTFTAAIGEATGSSSFSVNVSAEYGMGLIILFSFLIIVVAFRTKPETT
jgi:hypothetical protein